MNQYISFILLLVCQTVYLKRKIENLEKQTAEFKSYKPDTLDVVFSWGTVIAALISFFTP